MYIPYNIKKFVHKISFVIFYQNHYTLQVYKLVILNNSWKFFKLLNLAKLKLEL